MGRYGRSMVRMPYILRRKLLSRKRPGSIPVVRVIFISSLLIFLTFFAVLIPSTIAPTFAASGSEVSGIISQNTTWTLAGSPYVVTGSIIVNSGVSLTIEAGVEVRFDSGKGIQVDGALIAKGTPTQPITFTATTGTTPGSWAFINFTDSSTDATFNAQGNHLNGSIIQYSKIFYGGGGGAKGAIQISSASPYIDHNEIRYSATSGIRADNPPNLKLTNNTISDNGVTASIY